METVETYCLCYKENTENENSSATKTKQNRLSFCQIFYQKPRTP